MLCKQDLNNIITVRILNISVGSVILFLYQTRLKVEYSEFVEITAVVQDYPAAHVRARLAKHLMILAWSGKRQLELCTQLESVLLQ